MNIESITPKMVRKSALQPGFTLVELLIVLGIIAVIFLVGQANLRDFQRRRGFDGVISAVRSDLALAQQKALSGDKGPCIDPNELLGYTFSYVDSDTYNIEVSCSGPILVTPGNTDLPGGYVFSATWAPVTFETVGGGVVSDSDTTISLQQTATGEVRTITITSTGEID